MKRIIAMILVVLMAFGSTITALAADLDIVKKDGTQTISFEDFLDNSVYFDQVLADMSSYVILSDNGNYYEATQVDAQLTAGATTFAEATASLTPVTLNTTPSVSTVSATSATTVEVTFAAAPTTAQQALLTYTFAGAANTTAVYAGTKATLTVATMTDSTNGTTPTYAVVTSYDGTAINTTNVVYDKNEATTITVMSTQLTATVGTTISYQVKLVDEDGVGLANKALTLQLTPSNTAFEANKSLSATTDANGLATFTWTRNNVVTDSTDVFVNERPTVRHTQAAEIEWTTAASLISVAETTEVTLGDGTYKDYAVTFRNADNSAMTTGTVRIEINGVSAADTADTDYAVYYKDLSIADGAANQWKIATAVAADDVYTLLLDNTGAGQNVTTGGVVTFRVVNTLGAAGAIVATTDSIVPTFFYDIAGGTANFIDTNEPRVVGAKINYVAQIPTITLTQINSGTSFATAAASFGTAAEKAANQYKKYNLTVVDQYGNPFRGVIKIADYLAGDGIAIPAASANALWRADTNADATYDDNANNVNVVSALDLKYDQALTGADLNNDSAMQIEVYDATAAETARLAVWVENTTAIGATPDVAGEFDANDYTAFGETLSFAARAITTIAVTPYTSATTIAPNGTLVYKATVTDQFGDGITMSANTHFGIATTPGLVFEGNEANFDIDVDTADAENGTTFATNANVGTRADIDLSGILDNDVLFKITATGVIAADTSWLNVVFVDAVDDNYAGTEKAGSATFTTVASSYANAAFTAAPTNGTAQDQANVFINDITGNDAAETVTLTYQLQDQAGVKYDPATEPQVTFTVTNTGDTAVTVTAEGGVATSLAAGATGTYTVASTAGDTTIVLNPAGATDATGKIKVTVTATAAGFDNSTAATQTIYWYNATQVAAASSYTGTVVSNLDAGDYVILDTLVGYVNASYATGTEVITVNGNSATAITVEPFITVGDTVTSVTDGTDVTFTLTNN